MKNRFLNQGDQRIQQEGNEMRPVIREASVVRGLRRRAFTLIELITVMAISAILLSIISIPMFQTFTATRTAQAYSDAQDRARLLTDRISREINQAASVRDIEGLGGRVAVVLPIPARGVDDAGAPVITGGGFVNLAMNYCKLDLVLPARTNPGGAPGVFVDPGTGKIDPTLRSGKGQILTPVASGNTIRRYWIGLRNPFSNYNNPYDGLLMARSGGTDNLFVLYVAEVEPIRYVNIAGVMTPQVNTDFFDADPSDPTNRTPLYDDPNFFLATGADFGAPVNNDAKAQRVRNWLGRAQIVTELNRYDMIQPIYEKNTRAVKFNTAGPVPTPRVSPLIQFRPSHVETDSSDAQLATSIGTESDSLQSVGSEVFQGQYGLWSNLVVRAYPSNWAPSQPYQVGRRDTLDYIIFGVNPAVTGASDIAAGSGTPFFNISAYERFNRNRMTDPNSRYPFSLALLGPMATGTPSLADQSVFMPFSVNRTTGKLVTSFAISNVGNVGLNPNTGNNIYSPDDQNPGNLPQVCVQGGVNSGWTNLTPALTPTTDNVVAGTFSDAPYFDTTYNRFNINRVFNKIWGDAQAGRNGIPSQFGIPGGAHRFIDLRVVPQGDGTPSPLLLSNKAQIVPGSEEVFGPDQLPGGNNGMEIRYRRVNKEPGPNEYRINYTNILEPTVAGYAAMGLPVPPVAYDRTNFVSAVVQPRYKVGYIQLCSQPEVPIPAVMQIDSRLPGDPPGTTYTVPGRIRVVYKFQYNNANDVIRTEYDTRQLMDVLVTIRNYPQSSIPNPQTVTMKASANVRNFTR
jgi:prepilin-type N-terminal cleavage/methylation domain-containing protein